MKKYIDVKESNMRIAVIMPTYNEAANIGPMIEILFRTIFPAVKNAEMHLVVVDDTSPDGTGHIVLRYTKRFDRLYLSSGEKKGLGHAYVRGVSFAMKQLDVDAVMEMDADFQHNPRYLLDMISAFSEGADYVIGSRFIAGGSIPSEWNWYRKAVSVLGNRFARSRLKIKAVHDLTTGLRMTRVKGVLDRIDIENLMALDRFAYKMDLLYKTLGLAKTVVEVPIRFAPRHHEKSKFNLFELIDTYRVVTKLRISHQ